MSSLHVYTTDGCVQCGAVKRWLDEHGIQYTTTNIQDLPESEGDEILTMLRLDGHQRAPVTYFTHHGVVTSFSGFNPTALGVIADQLAKELA